MNPALTLRRKLSEDKRVRAFPVQTPLSRVLTRSQSKSPDAVIKLQITLDPQKDDWVPAEVEIHDAANCGFGTTEGEITSPSVVFESRRVHVRGFLDLGRYRVGSGLSCNLQFDHRIG